MQPKGVILSEVKLKGVAFVPNKGE